MSTIQACPNTVASVLVWGELLWDRFPDGDRLGGAPANVAYHLALLGDAPTNLAMFARLITRVGDDEAGARALGGLQPRIDSSLVQIDSRYPTGEVTITIVDGEPRYRLVPDRAWEHLAVTPAVQAALPAARALVFGTLAQRTPAGLAAFAVLMAHTPSTCVRVCDPNLRPGALDVPALTAALAAADVIKLGAAELTASAAALGDLDLLATLRRRCRLVAITRGAAGSTLYVGDEVVEVAAATVPAPIDNVGCGDAYVAVLTAGVVLGWPTARIGAVASHWAALVAGGRGATPPLAAVDRAAAFAAGV